MRDDSLHQGLFPVKYVVGVTLYYFTDIRGSDMAIMLRLETPLNRGCAVAGVQKRRRMCATFGSQVALSA